MLWLVVVVPLWQGAVGLRTSPASEAVGIALPGGGLRFWWQLGAIERVRQEFGGAPNLPIVGGSAGALASILLACDVDATRTKNLAMEICEIVKPWERGRFGLSGIWGELIREWLIDLLPEDAAERCRDVRLFIASRKQTSPMLWPFSWSRDFVGPFEDPDDLIDAAMASVHVPFFVDGAGQTEWRDRKCLDGSMLGIRRRIRRKYPNFVSIDPARDEEFRTTRALLIPNGVDSATTARAWIERVSKQGFDWADAQLKPGGELAALLSPQNAPVSATP